MREKVRTAAPGGLSCGSSPSRTIRCTRLATPKINQVYAVTYRGCTRPRTGGVRDGVHKPKNEPSNEPLNEPPKQNTGCSHCLKTPMQANTYLGNSRQHKKTNSYKKTKELRRLKHPLNPRPENLSTTTGKSEHYGRKI